MEIADKAFIVTGGASGLGEGTARMLAAEGAKVVITARQPKLIIDNDMLDGEVIRRHGAMRLAPK